MNIWDLRWNSLNWMIKKRSHLMNKINVILCYHYFQLCDLYENDSIFDKFECCLSGDGLRVATGSYGYFFHPLLTACVILQKSCLLTLPFPVSSTAVIYFVFLVVLLEAWRQQLWKQVGIQWGIFYMCLLILVIISSLLCHGLGLVCALTSTYPLLGTGTQFHLFNQLCKIFNVH